MNRMSVMRKKSIVIMLFAVLGAVVMANAASEVPVCPPQKCCCTPAPMAMPDHTGSMGMLDHTDAMDMVMENGCARSPREAMPCCDLESDVQPVELAVSTVSNSDQYRTLAAHLAADIHIDTPLVQTHINAYRDVGWPKIPKIPIFLQTLSILC